MDQLIHSPKCNTLVQHILEAYFCISSTVLSTSPHAAETAPLWNWDYLPTDLTEFLSQHLCLRYLSNVTSPQSNCTCLTPLSADKNGPKNALLLDWTGSHPVVPEVNTSRKLLWLSCRKPDSETSGRFQHEVKDWSFSSTVQTLQPNRRYMSHCLCSCVDSFWGFFLQLRTVSFLSCLLRCKCKKSVSMALLQYTTTHQYVWKTSWLNVKTF